MDGHEAGVLIVEYQQDEICLGRVEPHPDFQNRGVGGHLIRQLLDEGATRRQPLILDVLTVNPRVYQLYRRLGFHEVFRHGENNVRIRMRAEPPLA
ncbi:Acetyltransferase (GNAT) family protein [Streptoalloteichus tenebrarius]|uniref:Acetyltransferase (GNAT) family protein n=1 Tax=Streptoalloteichus tenebrarius (strain ATCC 17920 / DSM 40477 / JCM 4838 / CBS 697.72 / NBRC 16177 / NCIMB 11028 / NRRL B-12390 / A12253. 1 / ISP 5477) TaxID=1933 RepID=A0ABT1HNX1_STRSD|nr:GNAT family N-acetyltransferase [Streptoalloteichus tenebrarius]MCP2257211.1 Acetyltransferase (GNAT) family protein [Streptoalloteichus tenebrarius]